MYMRAKRKHLLQPLTALTSNKVKLNWKFVKQKAFDEIKQIVTHDTLLIYPDFNKCFDIHVDASDLQIGAVIIQEVKSIAFYRRKLTGLQTQHTVTET